MEGPGGDPWAEVDARILFDVQTGDWADARTIAVPAGSPVRENFDAYWVQTLAAAHSGDVEKARGTLQQLTDSIAQQINRRGYANTLHLYLLQARSAVEEAAGNGESAVSILKEAAAFEQAHPVDYPNVLAPPSAECLGMLLLKLRRPDEAAVAFRQALAMAPNTLRSVNGAKQAAAVKQRSAAN